MVITTTPTQQFSIPSPLVETQQSAPQDPHPSAIPTFSAPPQPSANPTNHFIPIISSSTTHPNPPSAIARCENWQAERFQRMLQDLFESDTEVRKALHTPISEAQLRHQFLTFLQSLDPQSPAGTTIHPDAAAEAASMTPPVPVPPTPPIPVTVTTPYPPATCTSCCHFSSPLCSSPS